jgi:hypothetical protein
MKDFDALSNTFQVLTDLNWISILIAFVSYFILGGLWFTTLFSKPYRVSLGKENEVPVKPAPIFIVGPALCCLVITLASAMLIYLLNVSTFGSALLFAMIVGLGYLVANTVNIAINPNIPKPLLYGLISGAYHLVGISIVSSILVLMK